MSAAPKFPAVKVRNEAQERTVTRAGMWLAVQLHKKTGVDVEAGITDQRLREQRIRALIFERGMTEEHAGYFRGKSENYRQFLKRALFIDLDMPQESLF